MLKYKKAVVGRLAVNCWAAYDDETMHGIIIDPGSNIRKIHELTEELGITVDSVVLTHAHFDHIAHADDVRKDYNVPLIMHEQEKEILSNPEWNLSLLFTNSPLSLEADRLVKDGDKIGFGNVSLDVIYVPGHTRGCMALLGEGVLFSGDTLFAGTFGRTDFPTGDALTLAESIRKLYMLPDETVVLPGHNEETTIGDEKQSNWMVRQLFREAGIE